MRKFDRKAKREIEKMMRGVFLNVYEYYWDVHFNPIQEPEILLSTLNTNPNANQTVQVQISKQRYPTGTIQTLFPKECQETNEMVYR